MADYVSVKLKVCEACGALWYRPATQQSGYCKACVEFLKDFPTVESRKRRGRPASRKSTGLVLSTVFAYNDEIGEPNEEPA